MFKREAADEEGSGCEYEEEVEVVSKKRKVEEKEKCVQSVAVSDQESVANSDQEKIEEEKRVDLKKSEAVSEIQLRVCED